ncbi:MAG: cysteine--tRNA ligase, partial [Bacteroidales bacterium]|nr:cysteine--tRNA ligase [Bacteroidales bacterium]
DDLNSPIVISHLFEASKGINLISDGKATINPEDLKELKNVFDLFIKDILGLKIETGVSENTGDGYKGAIDLLLQIRMEAKANKDWSTSDKIRKELTALGFDIKDTKDGFEWKLSR